MLTSPVALFVFNRPDTTRRVFEAIAQYKPAILLVVADGPRNAAEKIRCDEARRVVDAVDWDCRVLTHFSDTNLGCRRRMSSGISWVFEQCEQAIILEDDCLPDQSFFPYCHELLTRYSDDERVGLIGGFNYGLTVGDGVESYLFSGSVAVWGWAAWRRSWGRYDLEMNAWPKVRNTAWLTDLLGTNAYTPQWTDIFDRAHAGKVDTWDYQWVFCCFYHRMLSVVPARNLIQNIGFDAEATHTTSADNPLAQVAADSMPFPLRHPHAVAPDVTLQTRIIELQVGSTPPPPLPSLPVRALNKARRVLRGAAESARRQVGSHES